MKSCIVICFTFLCYTSGIVHAEVAPTTNITKDVLTIVKLPQAPAQSTIDNGNERIIGGTATTIQRFPYTVQVNNNRRLSCGGSLLTRRHVLSAAHCFFDINGLIIPPSQFTVRVGTANLESGGSTHSVSTVVIHERYNSPVRDNDIAVIVLSSRVTLNQRVAVASILAQGVEVPDNSIVIHVGWGQTNVNINQAASVLQEVTIRTVSHEICAARYQMLSNATNDLYIVTRNMICSGLINVGGADACQGDSGGPLVFQGVVVGVTSWGYGCGEPLYPGVNAKVSAYTNWINQTITRYNAGPLSSSSNIFLITTSLLASLFAATNKYLS